MATEVTFVSFRPSGKHITIDWNSTTYVKVEDSGRATCYIPGFDIFFGSNDPNEEVVVKKSRAIVKMFFDHFLIHSSKNGLKDCVLQLHKLGFKAPNDAITLKKLIANERISAKFSSMNSPIPADFKEYNKVSHEEQIEVFA